MTRNRFGASLAGPVLASAARLTGQAPAPPPPTPLPFTGSARIKIDLDRTIGQVDPLLFGNFASGYTRI